MLVSSVCLFVFCWVFFWGGGCIGFFVWFQFLYFVVVCFCILFWFIFGGLFWVWFFFFWFYFCVLFVFVFLFWSIFLSLRQVQEQILIDGMTFKLCSYLTHVTGGGILDEFPYK
jgi:hypothetical protein